MDRRRLLQVFGAGLTGHSGCTSNVTETSGTENDVMTHYTDGTAEFLSLEPTVFEFGSDGVYEIWPSTESSSEGGDGGLQYLFLQINSVSGTEPLIESFEFTFNDEAYEAIDPELAGLRWARDPFHRSNYNDAIDRLSGWIVFELPATGDASDSALGFDHQEDNIWRPSERLRERIAEPIPSITLDAWMVPDSVSVHTTPTFDFEVSNQGELTGHFSAAINARVFGEPRSEVLVSRQIPADETHEFTIEGSEIQPLSDTPSDRIGDGEPDIEYELIWSSGTEMRSVRIVA